MGNHEYCEKCGENDFHYGYPCNPEKVARVNKEIADRETYWKIKQENTVKKLLAGGITQKQMSLGPISATVYYE